MTQFSTKSGAPFPASATLIVFSDLDGTLLDHATYSFDAAKPALERLAAFDVPVILTSSKTVAEIKKIQLEMGVSHPAIAENGAGVYIPDGYGGAFIDGAAIDKEAVGYKRVRMYLDVLEPNLRRHFRGFGDMGTTAVCEATGLSRDDAERARQRRWSEPGLWLGTSQQLDQFKDALRQFGLMVVQGGRFLTISSAPGKQVLMQRLLECYEAAVENDTSQHPLISLALGDAPNDKAMLQAADIGVVIPGSRSDEMRDVEKNAHGVISRTERAGPEGWNEAVVAVLKLFPRYCKNTLN